MRSLHPDSTYFDFLDSIRAEGTADPRSAALKLTLEFPALRAEEAKAVCCDWRARIRAK